MTRPNPTTTTQAPEGVQDLFERLDAILVEEDRMHPIGCSSWEEEARVAIDMAKDFIRRVPVNGQGSGHVKTDHFDEPIVGMRRPEPGWLKRSIDAAQQAPISDASQPVTDEGPKP